VPWTEALRDWHYHIVEFGIVTLLFRGLRRLCRPEVCREVHLEKLSFPFKPLEIGRQGIVSSHARHASRLSALNPERVESQEVAFGQPLTFDDVD